MFKFKRFKSLLTGLSFLATVSMLTITLSPIEAHAGSFTHKHSDACYVTKTKTCSKHHIRTDHGTISLHCFTCGVFQTFNQTIYWDCCDNALEPNHDVAYQQRCSVCGSYRRNETPSGTRSHTYTAKEISCGLSDGAEEASVSLTADNGSWTNDGVVLSAGVSIKNAKFSLAGSPFSFSGGAPVSDSSVKVTENGEYSVTVTGSDGRTASASCSVSNIDRTAPTVTLTNITRGYSESGVDIQVSYSDDLSGVNEGTVLFNGGQAVNATTYHVSKNGTYSVKVSDNAGNEGMASIEVTTACKDPAVVAAEKAAAEKAAAEKAAAEKAAAEKAAAEKAAAEKAAAEKAAAEKAAAEKTKENVNLSSKSGSTSKNTTGNNVKNTAKTTEASSDRKKTGLFESISIIKKNAKTGDWKDESDEASESVKASSVAKDATSGTGSLEKGNSALSIDGEVKEVVTLGMADVTKSYEATENLFAGHGFNLILLIMGSIIALASVIFGLFIIRKTKSK